MNDGLDGLGVDFSGSGPSSGLWAVVLHGSVRGGCVVNPSEHGAFWWPALFALELDPHPSRSCYVGTAVDGDAGLDGLADAVSRAGEALAPAPLPGRDLAHVSVPLEGARR
jgi:hypothetical protein